MNKLRFLWVKRSFVFYGLPLWIIWYNIDVNKINAKERNGNNAGKMDRS